MKVEIDGVSHEMIGRGKLIELLRKLDDDALIAIKDNHMVVVHGAEQESIATIFLDQEKTVYYDEGF
jgi:hypothetical protein